MYSVTGQHKSLIIKNINSAALQGNDRVPEVEFSEAPKSYTDIIGVLVDKLEKLFQFDGRRCGARIGYF